MFKNMIDIIKKPQTAFLRIKDKKRKVFLHLTILSLILSFPLFLISVINPNLLFVNFNNLNKEVNSFVDKGIEINNNVLINPGIDEVIYVDGYLITMGNFNENYFGFIFSFLEEGIMTSFSLGNGLLTNQKLSKYDTILEDSNLIFSLENNALITNMIFKAFENNNQMVTTIIISELIFSFLDLVTIVAFLAVIATLRRKLPLPFGKHFIVNSYLVTIYALIQLILILFNLYSLSFLALIITYIYHFKIYNSIKIIRNRRGD